MTGVRLLEVDNREDESRPAGASAGIVSLIVDASFAVWCIYGSEGAVE
jgi:hypothetical protein